MSSSTMSSDGGPTVAVELLIDKEKKRVLYAESDKDFVDVLFSFMTLPLGTIVRLFDKQSQVGCLDGLYRSVESLSEDHFKTKACKAMLLRPVNAAAIHCDWLKVKVDDSNPVYHCKNSWCGSFSSVPDAVCRCGKVVQYIGQLGKEKLDAPSVGDRKGMLHIPAEVPPSFVDSKGDGVFVISGSKFIITEDLQVAPASTRVMFSLIDQFGMPGNGNIEEKVLQLNSTKMTSLLRRALQTKQPLTGLYFDVAIAPNGTYLPENLFTKQAAQADSMFESIKVRLVQTKDDSSVLYAEVGKDFVDLAFGLLSIPLATIMKNFSQLPQDGCMDNIYQSILRSVKQECQSVLLSPKLAPYFGCSSNVLQVEESERRRHTIGSRNCLELNPKSPTDYRIRAYIKDSPINFMVTNNLHILPLSLTSTIQLLHVSKIPREKLVEKELTLDKPQIMKIVGAAFVTREALSCALLHSDK